MKQTVPGKKPAHRVGFWARSLDLAIALSLTTGLLLVPATLARAQTTWTGNGGVGNASWNNASNWSNGVPNSATADAVFSGSSTLNSLTARLDFDYTVRSLTFNNGSQARAFTITAAELNGTPHDNGLYIGSGGITNNTALTQTISALIYLTANQSFTTVTGGTLLLASSPYNQVNLQGKALTVTGAGTTNIQSNIVDTTGGGSLVKSGSGVVTLTGANTYTGTTTINGGTLNVGTSTTSSSLGNGTGAVTINGGILAFGATSTANTATITNSGTLQFWDRSTTGTATITNNAGSAINFIGSSSAGGSTTTNNGTIYFQNSSIATNATIVNNSGGVVDLSLHTGDLTIGRLSGAGDIYLGSNSLNVGGTNTNDTISGGIRDGGYNGGTGGSLFKNGTGTLTLSGTNTFTGYLLVNAGTVVFAGSSNASASGIGNFGTLRFTGNSDAGSGFLTNNGTLSFRDNSTASNSIITNTSGGTLDISQHTGGIAIGQLGGNGAVTLGGNALTLGGNNADASIGGIISGTGGSLIKTGTGNLTLSGDSTYTGGVTINDGTLTVTGSSALGTGLVTNHSNLVFNTTSRPTLSNVLAGEGTITVNNSLRLSGANTFTGNLVVQNGASLDLTGSQSGGMGTITVLGGDAGAGSPSVSATNGRTTTLGTGQAGMSAVKNLILQGGKGGDTSGGALSENGGRARINDSSLTLENLENLTLVGGKGGSNLSGDATAGAGATTTFDISVNGALLPHLKTLTLTGGNGGRGGFYGGAGGDAQFIANSSGSSLGSQTTVIFAPGSDTEIIRNGNTTSFLSLGDPGKAILDLNGQNMTLGGIETISGAIPLHAIIQNDSNTNATLTVGDSANHSFRGHIQDGNGSGVLSLVKAGTGTQSLILANSYGGTTTITGGTLLVDSTAALGNQGINGLSLSNGTTGGLFGFTSSNNVINRDFTLSGTGSGFATVETGHTLGVWGLLSGSGSLTIGGPGTISLASDNTYTGGTIIQAGTLLIYRMTVLGTGAVTNNGTLTLNLMSTDTLNTSISGSGKVNKAGTAALTLSGNNSYAGGTTISGGTLVAKNVSALGTGSVTNNATLTLDTTGTGTFGNTISGSGKVTKTGTGTVTLTGNNTYTGETTLQGGTLGLGSDSAVGSGQLVLNGGTLQASGGARTINNAVTLVSSSVLSSGNVTTSGAKVPGLTLAGAVTLGSDSGLTVTGNTRVAITGVIGEDNLSRALIKDGTGTLVLTNDNTYTGGTLVRGTLVVNNAYNRTAKGSGTGEGAVTITRGGTLTGTYVISGAVQVNNGGTISVGNSIGTSQVGSLALSGGSLLDFEIGDDGISSDRIEIAGLLSRTSPGPITFLLSGEDVGNGVIKNLSEGTFTLMTFGFQTGFVQSDFFATGLPNDWNSSFMLTQGGPNPGTLSVTLSRVGGTGSASAPEPGTLALLLAAGGGVGFLFRARRRTDL